MYLQFYSTLCSDYKLESIVNCFYPDLLHQWEWLFFLDGDEHQQWPCCCLEPQRSSQGTLRTIKVLSIDILVHLEPATADYLPCDSEFACSASQHPKSTIKKATFLCVRLRLNRTNRKDNRIRLRTTSRTIGEDGSKPKPNPNANPKPNTNPKPNHNTKPNPKKRN